MSVEATQTQTKSARLTVRDLVTIDDGVMGPTGDKANLIKDKAAENLDMTIVEFCEEAIRCNDILDDRPCESYVRHVLRQSRPEAIAMFDNEEITYA